MGSLVKLYLDNGIGNVRTELWYNLLLVDELSELVVPEVQGLRVGRSEALDGGLCSQLHPNQLVSDPQRGREVHVQLDPLADAGRHVVLADTEVGAGLEPVDVDEREPVPDILLHLGALVLLPGLRLAQSDLPSVLSLPGDGRSRKCEISVGAVSGDIPTLECRWRHS